jgi:kynurenine formamidase
MHVALLAAALCGASCQRANDSAAAGTPVTTNAEDLSISVRRDIRYVANSCLEQSYDIYAPAASPTVTPPLLVFVHGGAWQSGDKWNHEALGRTFAKRGIVTAIVNYRLSPKVQHPTHVEDVAKAIAYLAKHAQGYDPKRIYVMGHSAGAHMCGLLASSSLLQEAGVPAEQLPKGFVGLEGIYDIPNLINVWPTYRDWFIEKAFGKDEKWASASPTRLPVKLRPPWLVIHSKADQLVDMAQSVDFVKRLVDSKVKRVMLSVDKLTHDGAVAACANPDSEVFKRVAAFVEARA